MVDRHEPGPLAEAQWLWRRLYIFGFSLVLCGLLAWIVSRMPGSDLAEVAKDVMRLMALMLVVYLIAPTAQQLIALLISLRVRMGGRR